MRTIDKRVSFLVLMATVAACYVIFPPVVRCQVYYCFSGSDWDGSAQGNIAIWRPSNGLWSVAGVTRFYYGGGTGAGNNDLPVLWTSPFSYKASPGVFRPSGGRWHMKYDFVSSIGFGEWGDIPVPANYDGNLADNIAVFRPSTGLWAVKSQTRFYFGKNGIPVPGYWLSYIFATPAIFRSGLWTIKGGQRFYFGAPGDIPVPGCYVGTTWQAAIFRPTTGLWSIRGITRFYFGTYGDWPMAADLGRTTFETTDMNDDPVIFRPSQGLWRIKGAFYEGGNRKYFGIDGDIPVAGPLR